MKNLNKIRECAEREIRVIERDDSLSEDEKDDEIKEVLKELEEIEINKNLKL